MHDVPPNRYGCAEFRRRMAMGRRDFIKAGLLGGAGLGLSLSEVLRAETNATQAGHEVNRENSVILLWMRGGPSHIDMWDPKPDAPSEIRGEFGTIPTRVPGIQLTDMLPLSAAAMDKWSIIRSLHHTDPGHSTGDQICFTGYPSGPDGERNVKPSIGAVVARQLQHHNPMLPAYVMVPRQVPGTDAAYLGPACRPFETIADPANDGPFQLPDFQLPGGLSVHRLDDRRRLLDDLDNLRRETDRLGQMHAVDEFNDRAWRILTGPAARQAFDLDAEPRALRERYGFIPQFNAPTPDRCGVPAWSQRILLARRLVEAGVRLVTVDLRWWDTHVEGFDTMRRGFLPRWDRAFTALIEDMEQRGLMDRVMVVAWGEFGRTPKVNDKAGRDHWPNVFSAAVFGGGIKGGRVVGASDANGAEPAANPKSPQDLLATIYRHLGVDTETMYPDHAGRPTAVLPFGKPIEELF